MNKGFGGKQQIMRNSTIKEKKCYIDAYNSILKVGKEQSMIFGECDAGPWWMGARSTLNGNVIHQREK